jgi:pimeloyl-ACP methyl ester carboxylesterase
VIGSIGDSRFRSIRHWPQLEAPDATNAALLAFLKTL